MYCHFSDKIKLKIESKLQQLKILMPLTLQLII